MAAVTESCVTGVDDDGDGKGSDLDGELGLAMRLRIHAVHADDPHMRICASRCACKNLDADQPHIEQKRVLQRQILQIHVV